MNWVVLSLPLVLSLAFLITTAVFYLSLSKVFTNVSVPSVSREEPDLSRIKEAFSKIFPRRKLSEANGSGASLTPGSGSVELLGTSVGIKSMALLKVDGKVVILREGQTKGGLTLVRVFKGRALVRLGDRDLELKVKRGKAEAPSRHSVSQHSTPTEFRISRRELERITKDPGMMFREIRLVPYVKNGRTEGFVFEWVKPGSIFYRAGLRRGDVLVSINNMTIQSGEDAFRLLQVLRNEPNLRVVVMRNGQMKEINIRIE